MNGSGYLIGLLASIAFVLWAVFKLSSWKIEQPPQQDEPAEPGRGIADEAAAAVVEVAEEFAGPQREGEAAHSVDAGDSDPPLRR